MADGPNSQIISLLGPGLQLIQNIYKIFKSFNLSFSGKTRLLDKILRSSDKLIKGGTKRALLFHLTDQKIYDDWTADGLVVYKQIGIPTSENFIELVKLYKANFIIVDDLAAEILKNIKFFRELFLVYSHHYSLSTFLVLHNIFTNGLRELNINAHRLILTYNARDTLGIVNLSRQAFPNSRGFLPAIYKDLGKTKYSYLVLDFHQETDPILKGE